MHLFELAATLGLVSLIVGALIVSEVLVFSVLMATVGYGGALFGWLMDHAGIPVFDFTIRSIAAGYRRIRTFRRVMSTVWRWMRPLRRIVRWSWYHPIASGLIASTLAVFTVATLGTLMAGAIGWYIYCDTSDMPEIDSLLRYSPAQIAKIYDRQDEVMIELGLPFRQPVEYGEVPRVMEQATIAAEDLSFYRHDGLPKAEQWWVPDAIYLINRWRKGKGGSSITMQLERNHDLKLANWRSRERSTTPLVDYLPVRVAGWFFGTSKVNTAMRKIREIKFSIAVEQELQLRTGSKESAKRLILARYLSTICYGYNMCGPESASRFFFGKTMQTLTISEAALLASFVPAPSRYGKIENTPDIRHAQKERRDIVIQRMARAKFITTAQAAEATAQPVVIVGRLPDGRTQAPAGVKTALTELELRGLGGQPFYRGQLRLHTTIDMRIQRIVNDAAQLGLRNYQKYYGERRSLQTAIVVMSNRGQIYAKYGGFSARDRNSYTDLDRTEVHRQAGSAVKPFVYLSVFRQHSDYTPDHQVYDSGVYPIRMGGGTWHYVHNYKNDAAGWIPYWEALSQSRNVPAIRLAMEETSIASIIDTARLFGIESAMKQEPSTALGSSDVTVLELTRAYATIFSGGISVEPYIIDHITDTFGETVWTYQPKIRRVAYPERAIKYTQMLMRGAVRLPRGTAHALDTSDFGIQVMCKTGTSDDCADARIGCGTEGPDGVTIAVWFGDDRGRISLGDKGTGARLALPVVEYIFKNIYGDKAPLGQPPEMQHDITDAVSAYQERAYPPSDK